MDNNNPELLDTMSELYDKNVADIKKGLYGEYIKTNADGTFLVQDKVLSKTLKIVDDEVLWNKFGFELYGKWFEAIPIISIKDSRYEQKFFENRTQMLSYDGIFESPDYFYSAKSKVAEIKYITPIEYMEAIVKGFGNTTIEEEILALYKPNIEKYAADMLKGDLFPMISIEYHEDYIDQEGRHRAMAVQHLIDTGEIPEDTLIPVVIVHEV